MKFLRIASLIAGGILLWQVVVIISGAPHYILPGPLPVVRAIVSHWPELWHHLQTTLLEIIAGLIIGTFLGSISALVMTLSPLLKRWMLPVLVISQAIPVFALAPVLVLWLGYGMASKIAMAVLIIYFPVTSSFYYGMQRTDRDLLELARIMGAGKIALFRFIIIPNALPPFGSGLRVATAVAPIGAIVGEWVGSSAGLGFYMLHANARMQIDIMFAALTVLALISLTLYFVVDAIITRILFWETQKDLIHEKTR
ncbi:ABC transporter permease [Desulfopila inferna]|uniref:ABC transporter permease n=1 Tax=Desulfopila inferna TaxID=468528 RepID=UPI0019639081|nr:ABC transporter permease [Desulfopila inferna]MBM9605342.1 ABC transporter permease [Desulfopila inferna]